MSDPDKLPDLQLKRQVNIPPSGFPIDVNTVVVSVCTLVISLSIAFYLLMDLGNNGVVRVDVYLSNSTTETNKSPSTSQDTQSIQPDATTTASDGDPPPIVMYVPVHLFSDDKFDHNDVLACATHPEVLLLTPFMLGWSYYTELTFQSVQLSIMGDDHCSTCWYSNREKALSSIAYQICRQIFEGIQFPHFRRLF